MNCRKFKTPKDLDWASGVCVYRKPTFPPIQAILRFFVLENYGNMRLSVWHVVLIGGVLLFLSILVIYLTETKPTRHPVVAATLYTPLTPQPTVADAGVADGTHGPPNRHPVGNNQPSARPRPTTIRAQRPTRDATPPGINVPDAFEPPATPPAPTLPDVTAFEGRLNRITAAGTDIPAQTHSAAGWRSVAQGILDGVRIVATEGGPCREVQRCMNLQRDKRLLLEDRLHAYFRRQSEYCSSSSGNICRDVCPGLAELVAELQRHRDWMNYVPPDSATMLQNCEASLREHR